MIKQNHNSLTRPKITKITIIEVNKHRTLNMDDKQKCGELGARMVK